MLKRFVPVAMAASMFAACQNSEPVSTVKEDAAVSESFKGQMRMLHPTGAEAGTMTVITRTRTFPQRNLIIEQTIQVDNAAPDKPTDLMTMITVDGTSMKVLELHDKYKGTGAFTAGEPWEWTAWNNNVVLEDGLKMSSQMAKSNNEVVMNQTLSTADDAVMFTFEGTLTEISEAEFKRLYKQYFPDTTGGGGNPDDDDDF